MLIGYEVSWDSCRGIRWIWVPPENGGMLSPSFDADKTGWFDGSQLVNPKKCNPNRHVSMLTVSAPPRPEDHGVRIHRPMDWVTETILRHLRPFFRNFDVSLLTIAHRLVTIADYDKVPGQRGIGRGQRSRRNCWDSWSTRHFIPSSISGGHRWSQSCVRLYMAIYIYILYMAIWCYMNFQAGAVGAGHVAWSWSNEGVRFTEERWLFFFRGQAVVAVVEAKQNFWHRGCF